MYKTGIAVLIAAFTQLIIKELWVNSMNMFNVGPPHVNLDFDPKHFWLVFFLEILIAAVLILADLTRLVIRMRERKNKK